MLTSGAVILAAGTMNIAELVLAERELGAGGTGFALLVSAYGCGLVGGSLLGARDAGWTGLRRRYLSGLGLMSVGLAGSAVAPVLGLALLSFAVTGAGHGLLMVSDRVMLQRLVPRAPPGPRVRVAGLDRLLGLRRRPARGRADRHDRRRPRRVRHRRRRNPARHARGRARAAYPGAPDHPRPRNRINREKSTPCRTAAADDTAPTSTAGADRALPQPLKHNRPTTCNRGPRPMPLRPEEHAMGFRSR